MAQLSLAWLLSKDFVKTAIVGASKVEHIEDNAHTSKLNLEKAVFTRIEEIMDNEPVDHGEHARWSYTVLTKKFKEWNNRLPSIAQDRREAKKEKEKVED